MWNLCTRQSWIPEFVLYIGSFSYVASKLQRKFSIEENRTELMWVEQPLPSTKASESTFCTITQAMPLLTLIMFVIIIYHWSWTRALRVIIFILLFFMIVLLFWIFSMYYYLSYIIYVQPIYCRIHDDRKYWSWN